MASHQISIRDDIYEKLVQNKQPGESFSDLINRLLMQTQTVGSIVDCIGSASDEEDEAVLSVYQEAYSQVRAQFHNRLNK